eukprot:scaffold195736_cov27-Tisochrysis_lutea.AAC.4
MLCDTHLRLWACAARTFRPRVSVSPRHAASTRRVAKARQTAHRAISCHASSTLHNAGCCSLLTARTALDLRRARDRQNSSSFCMARNSYFEEGPPRQPRQAASDGGERRCGGVAFAGEKQERADAARGATTSGRRLALRRTPTTQGRGESCLQQELAQRWQPPSIASRERARAGPWLLRLCARAGGLAAGSGRARAKGATPAPWTVSAIGAHRGQLWLQSRLQLQHPSGAMRTRGAASDASASAARARHAFPRQRAKRAMRKPSRGGAACPRRGERWSAAAYAPSHGLRVRERRAGARYGARGGRPERFVACAATPSPRSAATC